jgi:hypothetical protein
MRNTKPWRGYVSKDICKGHSMRYMSKNRKHISLEERYGKWETNPYNTNKEDANDKVE